MKLRKFYWIIVMLALPAIDFSWFGQEKKKEDPKKREDSKMPQNSRSAEKKEAEVSPLPLKPSIKPVTNYPTVQKVYKPVNTAVTTAVPVAQKPIPTPVPVASPSIDKIRQQISDIIRLNEDLKNRNRGQVAEIQRISDQARVHQQILAKLEAAPAEEKTEFKSSDVEEILKQEKIRLIGDETEKNRERINQFNEKENSKTGRKTES